MANPRDYRPLHPGMGQAVAERTYLRKKDDGEWETWGEVADRVALGNSLLCKDKSEQKKEQEILRRHLANGSLLMSGRHLQHGDENQPTRNMEVFTNCLDGDTKILTLEHGPVAISEVVGETVTVRARDGEWRPALVSSHGEQQLQEIRFGASNGTTDQFNLVVHATPNHRWFLESGEVTNAISVGDFIEPIKPASVEDMDAVRHGLVYGDGTAHKSRVHSARLEAQGIQNCSIRLCGNSSEWVSLFEDDYTITHPPHANGDAVVYVGRKLWKDLPHTTDPAYIAGFIKGWWMADGSKTYNRSNGIEIATTNIDAVSWLKDYAAYAGYVITEISEKFRKEGDGSFNNGLGKTLYCVRLNNAEIRRKVLSIVPTVVKEVFCVEEPVTTGFTLANGLVTGNCSTSASSFVLFYLLLNGSGVGRCYDDDMMLVNWDYAPNVRCVIDHEHKDFDWSAHESLRDAKHKYGTGKDVMWFEVPDSREGWAKALEIWENAAFQKVHANKLLILDFTKVRSKGSPIGGMQDRPSSGPVPLMNAFHKAATLKGAGLERWRQSLYIDHYFAECVLVGGARRSARMSTKSWRDTSVLDFITVKRPIEYDGLNMDEIVELRADNPFPPTGFLWSSNNSVTADEEFWKLVNLKRNEKGFHDELAQHARRVMRKLSESSYADGTGEPGIINVDKLVQKEDGWNTLTTGDYVGSEKYQLEEETELYMSRLARKAKRKKHHIITNPCGEIALTILGGYCTIADVVPFHADTLDEAEEAFRAATRALIRVNTMDCLYKKEVERTNRIGVGMTGVMEFAWKFFKLGFRDLIDEEKSKDFWLTLARFNRAVYEEAVAYSEKIGVSVPHTMTTIKPSGTISKLFGLCEGWHLPSMKWYVRWVQFRDDDPLIAKYRAAKYPVRELKQYRGHVIVGFPTQPVVSTIIPEDKLVTAGEATPEEQYKWLMLGEKYWIHGTDEEGNPVTDRNIGNQISYTLKYNTDNVDYKLFREMLVKYQSQIRCCSVMPQSDTSAYEYQPEQPVNKAEYEKIAHAIQMELEEDIGKEHVDCDSGSCPIDFNTGSKDNSKAA